MFFKKIYQKLEAIEAAQQIQGRMIEDILNQLDDRTQAAQEQRRRAAQYADQVSELLTARGAPAPFMDAIKGLFNGSK